MTISPARQNLLSTMRRVVARLRALGLVKGYSPDERKELWLKFDRTARRWEPKFADGAAQSLEHDKREILALLTEAKAKALQRKASVDWSTLLKSIEEYLAEAGAEHWREVFAPLIEGIVTDQGEKWATRLGVEFDVQPLGARDFFNNYSLTFAQEVNQTTKDNIAQIMARAQAEGSSIPEIQNKLDNLFERYISGATPDDPDYEWFTDRMPAYRTELIARDQTMRASNDGNHEIFSEWDIAEREWLSSHDDRVRDDHLAMDGKTAKMDEPWTLPDGSQMMFPGDDSMGADLATILQCRCTEIPVVPEEGL